MEEIGFEKREKRTEVLKMVLSKSEKQTLIEYAQQNGLTLSDLIRQALRGYLSLSMES